MSDQNNELNSSEKILLHATAMHKEVSKEEMKVLKKIDEKKYMDYFTNRYHELHYNFPALFNLIASDGEKFNIEKLKEMLRLRDRVDRNEVSNKDASEHIGKKYFNEYCSDKVHWAKEKQNKPPK